ncbi:MAG: hypothetical protein HC851_24175 [Acaryochloris sp. RU_4_1]|nr:hypothetical protein [Acaryochloris sp. RU_4_1]NJR57226.1 hypothetical protein [Acaryochloris sp. CRU_2_0]
MDDGQLAAEFRLYRSVVEMDEHLRKATGEAMTAELLQAMTGMKTMLDSLKLLKGYGDEVEDVQKRGEFMRIIGELSLELAETQIRLSSELRAKEDLERVIKELQKEIDELKTPTVAVTLKGNHYFTEDGQGPYCVGCYDAKRRLARVLLTQAGPIRMAECSQCHNKISGF